MINNVSIGVPFYNGGEALDKFLDSVAHQNPKISRLFALDSESTDDSASKFVRAGFVVERITRSTFRHGLARAKLLSLAGDAEFLVLLTQDAFLTGPESVRTLVDYLAQRPECAGAFGRQLPRHGAKRLEAMQRGRSYGERSTFRTREDLSQVGLAACFFSHSFGAWRTSILHEVGGFNSSLNFGEDSEMAARCLEAGYSIGYCATAAVRHSHDYSLAQEFRRFVDVGRFHKILRGRIDERLNVGVAGGSYVSSELVDIVRHHPLLLPQALLRLTAKAAGYAVGSRISANGRISRRLSMYQ